MPRETVNELLASNYHDLGVLETSTWQERTQILTEGGYAHYREKTATAMGELAEHLREKYEGDASRLVQVEAEGKEDAKNKIMKHIKEFKGIGDRGAEIFFEAIQGVVPSVAPAMSKRNRGTADKVGLGRDSEKMFEELEKDAEMMAQALTIIRLEGNFDEYTC